MKSKTKLRTRQCCKTRVRFSRSWIWTRIWICQEVFSERLYMSSPVRPSVCLSSVCNVRALTEAIEIFRNISTPLGTLAIC